MTSQGVIFRINNQLDEIGVPYEVNERRIESFLSDLESSGGKAVPRPFWLTMARLTELTLLCAGSYADNCEFSAAGDLLVNPRKILVRIGRTNLAFIKDRHGRLCDQLARLNSEQQTTSPISREEVDCEILTPALLPYLKERLSGSGFFQKTYLSEISERMQRIADTLSFLLILRVNSTEELHRRMQSAAKGQKQFIQRHLCRFDCRHFYRFGHRIKYESADQNLKDQPPEETLAGVDHCTIH